MPLDYADFAHHYEGGDLGDAERRENFDVFANVMECIVRAYFRDDAPAKALGISLEHVSLGGSETVDSMTALATMFNGVAMHAAGKKES